jgi:hypothetical protein
MLFVRGFIYSMFSGLNIYSGFVEIFGFFEDDACADADIAEESTLAKLVL